MQHAQCIFTISDTVPLRSDKCTDTLCFNLDKKKYGIENNFKHVSSFLLYCVVTNICKL